MTHYETLRRDGDAAYKAVMDALQCAAHNLVAAPPQQSEHHFLEMLTLLGVVETAEQGYFHEAHRLVAESPRLGAEWVLRNLYPPEGVDIPTRFEDREASAAMRNLCG